MLDSKIEVSKGEWLAHAPISLNVDFHFIPCKFVSVVDRSSLGNTDLTAFIIETKVYEKSCLYSEMS